MLDIDSIPDNVLTDILENKELPDDETGYTEVAKLSARDAFDSFLNWNGIIGYTDKLIIALDGLRKSEAETERRLVQNPAYPQPPL